MGGVIWCYDAMLMETSAKTSGGRGKGWEVSLKVSSSSPITVISPPPSCPPPNWVSGKISSKSPTTALVLLIFVAPAPHTIATTLKIYLKCKSKYYFKLIMSHLILKSHTRFNYWQVLLEALVRNFMEPPRERKPRITLQWSKNNIKHASHQVSGTSRGWSALIQV